MSKNVKIIISIETDFKISEDDDDEEEDEEEELSEVGEFKINLSLRWFKPANSQCTLSW